MMNEKKNEIAVSHSSSPSVKGFINWVKTPKDGVKPMSIGMAIGVAAILGVVDAFGAVVLLIASWIFLFKGHKGMSVLLGIVNLVIPDTLPLFDEAIQIVTVVLPLRKSYKDTFGTK